MNLGRVAVQMSRECVQTTLCIGVYIVISGLGDNVIKCWMRKLDRHCDDRLKAVASVSWFCRHHQQLLRFQLPESKPLPLPTSYILHNDLYHLHARLRHHHHISADPISNTITVSVKKWLGFSPCQFT